jgi:hypothetical protein
MTIVNKYISQNTQDQLYFPTTDCRVSKSLIDVCSDEDRMEFVQNQLEIIAAMHFLNHPALSNLS